mgnify:CR=1 FL=1
MPMRFGKSSLFCGLLFAPFLGYKVVAKGVSFPYMAEKDIESVGMEVRQLYEKGYGMLEKKQFEYAVELLTMAIEKEPAFFDCRVALRAARARGVRDVRGPGAPVPGGHYGRRTSGAKRRPFPGFHQFFRGQLRQAASVEISRTLQHVLRSEQHREQHGVLLQRRVVLPGIVRQRRVWRRPHRVPRGRMRA